MKTNPYDESVEVNVVNLQALKVAVGHAITAEQAALYRTPIGLDPKFIVDIDYEFMALKLRLKSYIWSYQEAEFEWYADWWQELRVKLLPKWWIKKHPSKKEYRRVTSTYPSLLVDGKDHKARIYFTTFKGV